jgi:diadenylate cyclase
MRQALRLVAPGAPLREGLERVLLARRGALVVVGDGPPVLSICTGGFLLDAEYTPQRLSELAKMDGAIVLSADAKRIARANVQLMPDTSVPTSETGTRHRTAERVARSLGVPVVSVSAAMGVITLYCEDQKHVLLPAAQLNERVSQALQSLQRFRQRFDLALTALSALEVEDTVSLRDVAAVIQPAELVLRLAEEVDAMLVELGEEGRLWRMQLDELTDGVAGALRLVVRDYLGVGADVPSVDLAARSVEGDGAADAASEVREAAAGVGAASASASRRGARSTASGVAPGGTSARTGGSRGDGSTAGHGEQVGAEQGSRGAEHPAPRGVGPARVLAPVGPSSDAACDEALRRLRALRTEELLDPTRIAAALGIEGRDVMADTALEPRGYRLLHRLPRFPEALIERIVEHFRSLHEIMRASVGELERVGGVGETRARTVKAGLQRLAEASILERSSG